jgi:hypothetical protein
VSEESTRSEEAAENEQRMVTGQYVLDGITRGLADNHAVMVDALTQMLRDSGWPGPTSATPIVEDET